MAPNNAAIPPATRERQSRVSQSGADWEEFVADYMVTSRPKLLEGRQVTIIDGRSPTRLQSEHPRLYRILRIPVINERYETEVWGDIDLIAAKGDVPVAIISCKTSLHGRLTETLFYSLLYRAVKNLRVVVATPDRGRQGGSRWQSEWGGPGDDATKDRLLAEAFLAGVYVQNSPQWCPGFDASKGDGTRLGGIVKALGQLPDDLVRWSEEVGNI